MQSETLSLNEGKDSMLSARSRCTSRVMWRSRAPAISSWRRHASVSRPEKRDSDVRVSEIGPLLDDDYASLRDSYRKFSDFSF